MKEKRWIFFRVMVYSGLAGAGLILSVLVYFNFLRSGNVRTLNSTSVVMITASLLQIIFNILNVRLIHYHLFNKQLPASIFSVWHTVLMVLNSGIAIALLCIFLYGCAETFTTNPYHKILATEDVIALVLIGTYAFITIYTITGSWLVRRYIRYTALTREEEWLNRLGT